jgi:hypothetical protein
VGSGYIQDIHPEDLDVLVHLKDEMEMPLSANRDGIHALNVQLPATGGAPLFSQASV